MRTPVDNRFTSVYIVYYFCMRIMPLPGRRNGRRHDAEGIAPVFEELDDVRQGIDGRLMAVGIVHQDDQVAVQVRPQFQLLLDVFDFGARCLARAVSITGQGIPADFDIADLIDGRPVFVGKMAFRTAGRAGNDGTDADDLVNGFFRL